MKVVRAFYRQIETCARWLRLMVGQQSQFFVNWTNLVLSGVLPISPSNRWTVEVLIKQLLPSLHHTQHSLYQNSTRRPDATNAPQPNYSVPTPVTSTPSTSSHPLTILHDMVLTYVEQRMPTLMEKNISEEINERSLENPNLSIYARRRFIIPDGSVWQTSMRNALEFLYETHSLTKKAGVSARTTLADFLTRPNRPGGRKGEYWGRGDWNIAEGELLRLFAANDDVGDLVNLKPAIEDAFTRAGQALR